ncbi:MAG: hypothetical protein Q4G40_08750, partial [Brachybacterium sp.]|nr:hypothetical protein [Brachybacterium sp.]
VRSDGRMVAAMMVHTGSDGVLMFSRLSVLPSENTMGWARVLFDWLLDEAVRLGAPAVGTLVPADRPRLRKLGEAGGMTVRDRGLRLGLDDEMHEVLYMTRDVPTL